MERLEQKLKDIDAALQRNKETLASASTAVQNSAVQIDAAFAEYAQKLDERAQALKQRLKDEGRTQSEALHEQRVSLQKFRASVQEALDAQLAMITEPKGAEGKEAKIEQITEDLEKGMQNDAL